MNAATIAQALNAIQALISWIATRGINRNRVQKILDNAVGSDITSEQVQTELDATKSELDDTDALISG